MPRSFRTQAAFRAWLQKNHTSQTELILRLFKTHAKSRGVGYKEALDEALCFGWIDGVRHALDEDSFTVRFTPRKPRSKWSQVNIKRVAELEAAGLMHAAGLAAFRTRGATHDAPYSYENKNLTLDAAATKQLRANKAAWEFFQARPPWYRRTIAFWIKSAKREETRAKRLAELIDLCAKGKIHPGLERKK